MKKKLNLHDPQTFNEKMQWLKLYNRNPQYTALVDKYEVKRKWGSGIYGSGRKLNPIKMPNKPLKKEIEREIGKHNIVTRNRGMHNIAQFSQTMRETNNIFSNIN